MRLSDLKSIHICRIEISTIHINHQIVLTSYDIIIYVIYIITYTYIVVSYKSLPVHVSLHCLPEPY